MPAFNIRTICQTTIFKIALIIIAVALISGLNLWRNHKYSGTLVHTTKVEEKVLGEKVYASGRIELQEKQEAVAQESRILKQLYVKTGERVKAGQLLAVLDCPAEERSLADALAALASEELRYKELVNPSAEDLAIGQAEFEEAKITCDNKRKTWERKEALCAAGAISAQEMETARQELLVQEAAFLKAQKSYDILCHGPRAAERQAAEANLSKAQSAVQAAEEELARYTIKAEMNGVILNIEKRPGDMIKAGDIFISIGQPERLQVKVGVSEADAARVKPGQKVLIEAAALPEKIFAGKVSEVAGLARTKEVNNTRQVEVAVGVSVEDKSGRLKPGYSVDLEIISVTAKKRLVIPYEALQENRGKKQVWIYDDGKARLQTVTIGVEGELQLEVTKGLKPGDLLILDPPKQLKNGDKVRRTTTPATFSKDEKHD
ncbi:efflux RND transporter periplasmic adaptor subunit [Syntrophomonas wolfei]|jgi:HlyD family secretion protein|uniref:efflux RND transporter periplasmic adaptor subunit n=1 Tax=Syntrophomonas wolfei TaxID=863 RepID=UPI0023F1DF58|nr:efflux RND transporter periplasmic adaptor subunit [Syntrophomonas wolfei]